MQKLETRLSSKSNTDLSIQATNVYLNYMIHTTHISTLKEYFVKHIVHRKRSPQLIREALKNISFTIRKGESISIVGHNGSGKSTLLKVIAGVIRPNSGKIEQFGRIAPLIELGAGFDPELTGEENVHLSCTLMGLSKREIEQAISPIKDFSELKEYFYAPVKSYSSGMYMRLAFSCATAISAEVVLIDEVLSVGDINFQEKCAKKMDEIKNSGATIVLVSHDIDSCVRLTDRMLVLDEGVLIADTSSSEGAKIYRETMSSK